MCNSNTIVTLTGRNPAHFGYSSQYPNRKSFSAVLNTYGGRTSPWRIGTFNATLDQQYDSDEILLGSDAVELDSVSFLANDRPIRHCCAELCCATRNLTEEDQLLIITTISTDGMINNDPAAEYQFIIGNDIVAKRPLPTEQNPIVQHAIVIDVPYANWQLNLYVRLASPNPNDMMLFKSFNVLILAD